MQTYIPEKEAGTLKSSKETGYGPVHISLKRRLLQVWNPTQQTRRKEVGASLIMNTDVANPTASYHIVVTMEYSCLQSYHIRCLLLMSTVIKAELEGLGFSKALPHDIIAVS